MTDAAALDAAASALAGQAGTIPGLLDRALARSGVDVWQGPAQEDLADDLVRLRGVLRSAAGELSGIAARLRAEAATARAAEERAASAAAPAGAGRRRVY
jgi:uncharacterized protein YukE